MRRRQLWGEHPDLGEIRLELHDDGLVLYPQAPGPAGLMSLTLRDDCGTLYQVSGEYGDRTKFVPAVPTEAEWLDVLGPSDTTRFNLRV